MRTAPELRGRAKPLEVSVFILTKLAVARRSVTILIALAVFGGGVASWGSLKQELLPNIDFPIVTVI
ncbi:MAG: hypothetical protein ACKO4O_01105, partial [Candidatus Limnocylindrus sp.]